MTMARRTMLRMAAALSVALAVLFAIPGQSAAGGADPAGTANGGGTILFSRHNHWYTIAPTGTHLHLLLSRTGGCRDFGCGGFSPDGRQIMVAAWPVDHNRVATAIINTTGSGYHVLPLPDARLNLGPGVWTPNGARVALNGWDNTNKARAGIYMVNAADGKGLVRLTARATPPTWAWASDTPLAYSPNGSRLLFFHEVPPRPGDGSVAWGNLFETTAEGAGRIHLNPPGTSVTPSDGSPASWSPDGKQLTFTAFSSPPNGGQSAVFVANANGSHLRRITAWGEWSTSAHWSPDGTWIVFDKIAPGFSGAHNLYLIHPNGTGLKAITSTSLGGVCCAVWSPDGKRLLFREANLRLLTVNRDGSGVKYLTVSDPSPEAEYAWGR